MSKSERTTNIIVIGAGLLFAGIGALIVRTGVSVANNAAGKIIVASRNGGIIK